MFKLPNEYLRRMQAQLQDSYALFLDTYTDPPTRGIRVNTLKISAERFAQICPFPLGDRVPWEPDGFYAYGDGLGKSVAHAAGLYYVQEPSAMSAAPKLEVKAGERVLDLCSAPGGKGTQLAQKMQGKGVIVMNEPDGKRYATLCGNVERMGIKNAVVTCANPKQLEEIFEGYFDKILVDAPCSGEGMFRKEPASIAEWSADNVRACAARQQKILGSAHKMLASGGRMVYSTCTFSTEEDEEQIESFLNAHGEYKLTNMQKLYPFRVRGEGHFYAVLEKSGGTRGEIAGNVRSDKHKYINIYKEWESATLLQPLQNIYASGNLIFDVKEEQLRIASALAKHKIPYRAGVFVGEIIDNKRFEPAHSLVMSLKCDEVRSVDVDRETALAYLRGMTFDSEQTGWRAVTYSGYPVGWCKCVNGTAKNHLPKGLRI